MAQKDIKLMAENKNTEEKESSCCRKESWRQGVLYGFIPHLGCIAFIIGSVLGVTFLMNWFKPLLMNRYFFHALISLSLGLATLSSILYLKKNNQLSRNGIKKNWKYLAVMYGSTIGINLALFLLIFPLAANFTAAGITGAVTVVAADKTTNSLLELSVDIPCPGHAALITGELKTLEGVKSVQFSFPNVFEVSYDQNRTDKESILALEVFKTYRATVISENQKIIN